MWYPSLSNEDGREQRKYIGLDIGNKQFHKIYKHGEDHRDHCHGGVDGTSEAHSDKDEYGESQHNGVPSHDVGKETDHQGKGLGDCAHDLYQGHQWNRYF